MGEEQVKTGGILDRIAAVRRQAVEEAKRITPAALLEERIGSALPVRDFRATISRDGINVIAECKKASPSEGVIRSDYNPAAIAAAYEAAGACALSVLTEPKFFRGGLEDLTVARSACDLPVLRKDFLFDEYQLLEARAAGADAFLLIVAMLTDENLVSLMKRGGELGMAALVEVHDGAELERAAAAGAGLIGVNNRNLKTMEVDIETSVRLREKIPSGCVAVSESGLQSRQDLERLRAAGYSAFLIGTLFMKATGPGEALRAILGPPAGQS